MLINGAETEKKNKQTTFTCLILNKKLNEDISKITYINLSLIEKEKQHLLIRRSGMTYS